LSIPGLGTGVATREPSAIDATFALLQALDRAHALANVPRHAPPHAATRFRSRFRAAIDRLKEVVPTAEMTVILNASHRMITQNPEVLDAALLGFLSRHAAPVPA
jgi:pimeloyl-ACP methyl ester carboxylesterase